MALYQACPDVGGPTLVKRTIQPLRKGIEAMLLTGTDVEFLADKFAIDTMLAAMSGADCARCWRLEV